MARRPEDEEAIGDAGALFREDTPRTASSSRPVPLTDGDGYDVLGDDPGDSPAAPPVLPEIASRTPRSTPAPSKPVGSETFSPPPLKRPSRSAEPERRRVVEDEDDFGPTAVDARVDRPWSRWAEWGPDVIRVGLAAVAWIFVLYLFINNGSGLFWTFLVFALGLGGLLLMCYPMAITMEPPIRVTPEQAARDYFGALAHFRPHYRRMWLLLSSAGQNSAHWRNFAEFRDYWRSLLAGIRQGKTLGRGPLNFQIQDFRSEKSAGKTALNAKFTVRVRAQDFSGELGQELGTYRLAIGLVRGPDKMWYLNDGVLPIRGDSAS